MLSGGSCSSETNLSREVWMIVACLVQAPGNAPRSRCRSSDNLPEGSTQVIKRVP